MTTQVRPERLRGSVRLLRPVHLAVYVLGLGVWTSGLLWLLFDKFLVRQGEFGPEKLPAESWILRIHGLLAVGVVWLFGMLWGTHIMTAWPGRRRRLSGGALTAWIVLLIVSGYLLYYVAGEDVRRIVSVVHWGSGIALPLLFAFHRWKRRMRRETRA